MAKPRRPRGRPPLPAGERKAERETLTFRPTNGMKEELVRAAKRSGRSLAQEIEDRLGRSLWEDRDKNDLDLRLDILTRQIQELVRACWADPGTSAVDTPRPLILRQHPGLHGAADPAVETTMQQPEAGGQWRRVMLKSVGEPGELGRLHEIELSVACRDDGSVALVYRTLDGLVFAERLLDPGEAKRAGEELLAAACGQEPAAVEPKRQPKSRRAR